MIWRRLKCWMFGHPRDPETESFRVSRALYYRLRTQYAHAGWTEVAFNDNGTVDLERWLCRACGRALTVKDKVYHALKKLDKR